MKLVINAAFGGFSVSDELFRLYLQKKNIKFTENSESSNRWLGGNEFRDENDEYLSSYELARDSKELVEAVEELMDEEGFCGDLRVVEIPDGVDYSIEEYDGKEWVAEAHRTWR